MEHVFETLETDAGLGVVVDGTMAITGVTAQREEIVRCRDCEYAMEHRSKSILGTEIVTLTCSGPIQGAYSEGADVEPEDFCSLASRREDGQCRTLR